MLKKMGLIILLVAFSSSASSNPLNASIKIMKTKLDGFLNEEVRSPSDALKVFIALSFLFEGYARVTYDCKHSIGSYKGHSFCIASDLASKHAYKALTADESQGNLMPFIALRNKAYEWGMDHPNSPVRMGAELGAILRDSLSVVENEEFSISKDNLLIQIKLLSKNSTNKTELFLSPFTETLQVWVRSNL